MYSCVINCTKPRSWHKQIFLTISITNTPNGGPAYIQYLNSERPSNAYMYIYIYMCVCVYMRHQTTRPALDYIMACRLVSEPMLFYWQLGHWEHISLKSNSKFINFHWRKYIWKYRLFCLGLYIHVKLGLGCWWQRWVKKHNVFFETPLCLVISNHRCGPDDIIQNGRRDLAKYRGTCRYSPWTRELITVAAADKDINLEGLGWWGPFQVCPKSRTHEIAWLTG